MQTINQAVLPTVQFCRVFQFVNVWLNVNSDKPIYQVDHLNTLEAKMLESLGLSNQSYVEVWAPTCLNPENEFYPEMEHPEDTEVWIMISENVDAPVSTKIIVPNVWENN